MRLLYILASLIMFAELHLIAGEAVTSERITTSKDAVSMSWQVTAPSAYDQSLLWPLLVMTVPKNCGHVDSAAWPLYTAAGYFVAIADAIPEGSSMEVFADLVADAATQVQAKFRIDISRTYTLGFSVHGMQAMYVALSRPKVFYGAISLCHVFMDRLPTAKNCGHPLTFLVLSGDQDYNYPVLKMKSLYTAYEKAGHQIQFLDVPGLPHLLRTSEVPAQIAWLDGRWPVNDYAEQLAKAQKLAKAKNWTSAKKAYMKLVETKRAHPVVAAAKEGLALVDEQIAMKGNPR